MLRISLTRLTANASASILSSNPDGAATPENLAQSGYLLRCYLTVHKAMEVRERALREVPEPAPGD